MNKPVPTRRVRKRQVVRQLPDTTVPSPCIGVCTLDDQSQLCKGCLRNVDEIREWMIMNREQKLAVLEQLKQRQ